MNEKRITRDELIEEARVDAMGEIEPVDRSFYASPEWKN